MHVSDPIIQSLLVQVGFSDVAKLGHFKISNVLVTTLVERWRPESHNKFHLAIGVDRKAVIDQTYFEWEKMCAKYLGVIPPKVALVGSTLKLKCLKENIFPLPKESTKTTFSNPL